MSLLAGIHPEWKAVFATETFTPLVKNVLTSLENLMAMGLPLSPPAPLIFRVFKLPPSRIRVVIVGQDPYNIAGLANGLAFGAQVGAELEGGDKSIIPGSLRNIMARTGCRDASLISWFTQGVFLLNCHLTSTIGGYEDFKTSVHQFWQPFTRAVVTYIDVAANAAKRPLVIMLWGVQARTAGSDLNQESETTLTLHYHHPSPKGDAAHNGPRWNENPNFVDATNYLGAAAPKWATHPMEFSWPRNIFVTDGACTGNGTPRARAGYAFLWLELEAGNPTGPDAQIRYRYRGVNGFPIPVNDLATNQRAELLAILGAFVTMEQAIVEGQPPPQFAIITDSEYSIKQITGYNKSVANVDLIDCLKAKYAALLPLFVHVRSHNYKGPNTPQLCPTNYDDFVMYWNHVVDGAANKAIP